MRFRKVTTGLVLAMLSASLFAASACDAATITSWDFSGLDLTGFANDSPAPDPILASSAATVASGLTTSDLTDGGSNLQTSSGNLVAGEANFKNWDVGDDGSNDNFMEFTLTADVAGTLSISSISVRQWRNGGAAPNGMAFDVNVDGGGYALYDAVQSDNANGLPVSFDTFTFAQAISGATTVGIRFTPRNSGSGGTGNIHINALTVDGQIVPEPSSILFVIISVIGVVLAWRRQS